MGIGASKNRRSTVVSSSQQPTRITNRTQRDNRRESTAEYEILPGIKTNRRQASNAPLDAEAHQQRVLGAAAAEASASRTPVHKTDTVFGGPPVQDDTEDKNSRSDSISSNSSTRSVSEDLDDLRTELDQVLVGHYYAINKPTAGVLKTAEIAVLERHNQLQPLPLDYQPVIGNQLRDGRNTDWIRPIDLVQQERELIDRRKREEESFSYVPEQTVPKEGVKKEEGKSLVVYDLEDEQDRGDFDIQKFQAVNVAKAEPNVTGMDIFSQSTYKNYSSVSSKQDRNMNSQPKVSEVQETTKDIYDPSEEELLRSIEQDFNI